MYLAEHQMRSLTVCTVTLDVPKWVSTERTRSKRDKLAGLFGSKHVAKAEEYLLILTCDRLAVLRADPGTERDDLVERSTNSNGTSSSSLLETNPPFVSLPLTLVQDVYTEGSYLVVEHYLAGNPSLSPASSSGGGVDEEERSVHFPFLSAIGRIIKGDKNHEGVLRLGTGSETSAQELARAVSSALSRLYHALIWLDRGLPLDLRGSIAVSTISIDGLPLTGVTSPQADIIVSRAPAWGSIIHLPAVHRTFKKHSHNLHIDLSTPLGPYHANVPLTELIDAHVGLLTVLARRNAAPPAAENGQNSEIENNAALPDHNYSVSITLGITAPSDGEWESSTAPSWPWVSIGVQTGNATGSSGLVPRVPNWVGRQYTALAVLAAVLAVLLVGSIGQMGAVLISVLWMLAGAAVLWNVLAIVEKLPGGGNSASPAVHVESDGTATLVQSEKASGGLVIKLMHAEIAEELREEAKEDTEAPGDDLQRESSIAAAQIEGEEAEDQEGPLIARRFTESLAVRHRYLENNSRAAGHGSGAGGLVDIGAVNLRRVITTTATSVTIEEEERAEFVQREGSFERGEASALKLMHSISPIINKQLLDRYVVACGGDRGKAMQRLRQTAEWRTSHGIDTVLSSPIPHFSALKSLYLHSVIGWTKDGTMPVVIEGMGGFKSAITNVRKQKIAPADLIHQFIFMMEWVIHDLTPGPLPSGTFVRIYDLKGIGLLDLADKEAIGLGQQMMDILEKYYPERMAHAFVVNTPSFFATAWKMVKPLLDPRTAKKIQVLSNPKMTLAALRELMDDDTIPKAYGGNNDADGYTVGFGEWYESKEEKKIAALAAKLNGMAER